MEDKKTIRCYVREDSVYEILQGILIDVVRDKAFYRILHVHSNNALSPEIRAQYVGKTIGREQLDFKNSIEIEVDESKDIPEFSTGAKRDSEGKEDIRIYETGAKRDSDKNKPYVHNLQGYVRLRFGYLTRKGAEKYGDGNFLKGFPTDSAIQSLDRHWAKYLAGDRSEDHLSAMIFGIQLIMLNEEKDGIKPDHWFDNEQKDI